MRYCGLLIVLMLGLGVGATSSLRADSWAMPSSTTTTSKNQEYRFVMSPADPLAGARAAAAKALAQQQKAKSGAAATDKASEKKLPAQAAAAPDRTKCWGRLEHKTKDGKFELVWERELSNDVAPVSVLVSDSGSHVVTLDNWHSVGRGSNVVVIYGPKGKLVREIGLSDFLSKERVAALPLSVSSTWWGQGHYLDEKKQCLVLRVAKDKDWMFSGKPTQFEEVRLSLETGKAPSK